MDGQPLFAVAWVAMAAHIFSFIGAALLEWAFNPRGWTRGLNNFNSTSKLFTARRREVRFFVSWVLIWTARLALLVAGTALIAGLILHNV